MDTIITLIREGLFIEAVKAFRSDYNVPLKDAKDACDVLRAALGLEPAWASKPGSYVTITCYLDGDNGVINFDSKEAALADAVRQVESHQNVTVARVIARSVTRRTMEAV